MTTANLKRKLRLPKCESYKAANSSFILNFILGVFAFRFSHPRSSKGRNRESGPLSVYFLYISSLKPEYDLIGSPKKLIQLQNRILKKCSILPAFASATAGNLSYDFARGRHCTVSAAASRRHVDAFLDLFTRESPRLERFIREESSQRAPPFFCGWWEYKLD